MEPIPRPAYTHKAAAMKTNGTFWCNGEEIDLNDGLACSDWTKSVARRNTTWQWANFSATVQHESKEYEIGINLSAKLYEDTQNVVFVNGKVYPLSEVVFEQQDSKEYTLKSTDTLLNLKFTELAAKKEDTNLLIVKDKFTQSCGMYNGTIQVGIKGKLYLFKINNCVGVLENHSALW